MADNLVELFHSMETSEESCALCSLATEVRKECKSGDELRPTLSRKASQCTAEEADITSQIDLKAHAKEKLEFELKKINMSIGELERKRKIVRHKRVIIQNAIAKIGDGTFGQYVSVGQPHGGQESNTASAGSTTNLTQQPSSHAAHVTPKQPSPVVEVVSSSNQGGFASAPTTTAVDAVSNARRLADLIALLSEKSIKDTHLQKGLNQFESFCVLSVGTPWEPRDYAQYVDALRLLLQSVATARPPIQAVELRIVNALLKRSTSNLSEKRPIAPECRPSIHEVALASDALNVVCRLFGSVNDEVKCEAVEMLTSLCMDVPTKERAAQGGAVTAILAILNKSNHEQLLERSLIAMWHLAMSDPNKVIIRDAGGIQIIVELLSSDCHPIVENVTIGLGYLTRDDNNKVLIRKCSGIEKLISTLYYPSESVQSTAAGALWNCASNVDNKIAIRQLGGIQPLIGLLSSTNEAVVENASGTLWNCAAVGENRIALRKLGGLDPLLKLLHGRNEHIQENAAGAIRNCAINDQNKVALKELGGIEMFVDLLDRTGYSVLEKITSTLWICSINNDNKHVLRTSGGFPKLLRALDNENLSIKEKALGILRNCSTLAENRAALNECNAVAKLVHVLSGQAASLTPGIKEYAAATLWNIARDDKTIPREQGAIRVLVGLLGDRTEGVVENVAGALLSLTINADNRDHLRDVGGLQALVQCLGHSNEFILENTVGTLKNCTANNERNQASVRDLGAIPRIVELLSATNEAIVRESALCLKNLGANDENNELIGKYNGVVMLNRLQTQSESDAVRKVAAFALQTLSRGPHTRR